MSYQCIFFFLIKLVMDDLIFPATQTNRYQVAGGRGGIKEGVSPKFKHRNVFGRGWGQMWVFGMQGNVFQLKHPPGLPAPPGLWEPVLVSGESERTGYSS